MRTLFFVILALVLLPVTLSAQTLERIQSSGQIKLGFRTDAAPLSFVDDQGRPNGYSPTLCVAVAQRVAKHLGLEELKVTFEPVDVSSRFDKVASGEIDLLCGAASITLSRLEVVDFSVPTYVDGTSVILQNDIPSSLSGLANQKIGVRGNTTTAQALENSLEAEGITAEIVSFADHNAAMAAMESGEIKGYFADQSILMNLYINSPKREAFKVFDKLLTIEKQGLAMARGDADFRLVVDTALSELFRSGAVKAAFNKAVPGAEPGVALQAMFLLSPTIP
jgi:polar amino acid transport system substrate-binding protein/glutamate/aspartate transport system substrate-binding protein